MANGMIATGMRFEEHASVRLGAEITACLKTRRVEYFRQLLLAGAVFASMAAYPAFQCNACQRHGWVMVGYSGQMVSSVLQGLGQGL